MARTSYHWRSLSYILAIVEVALAALDGEGIAQPHGVPPASSIPTPTPRSVAQRATVSVPPAGYYNPYDGGGSLLTAVVGTYPPGQGEPINAIISAYSDSAVLQSTASNGGLINYYQSFGFSTECLGQHAGNNQGANLGDGNGYLNQTAVIRWDYGDPTLGTCEETIEGGNHVRYWIQDGSQADSGAIFMAVSYEMPIAEQHNIVPNGYNLGRDWLVGNATSQSQIIPTLNDTNSSTYSGQTAFNGYTYSTSVKYVSGLLPNTSYGINHNGSVPVPGDNAVDGLVAVMTVKIVGEPASSGAEWSLPSTGMWTLSMLVLLLSIFSASPLL
ncbi:hypothetical protein SERLA73DRAFT_189200 [Serpula lacrymans var. lacrymans S7.3]|uniref:Uncharacterized protein n=2 Tax=Serpula lacrymans var. lacrymans TaxID=341189 RepID=F8QD24_SERL3|nr:uncharacterized protein SERLADRAFT_479912 [Serpula lacrymans var. lacrymans S7.9]EGN94039.1 hypothetical protein SERLA73DRAFT_189200 [Serpula lacrymans var. lacrymans S7.3]EGO19388.1 hypothetical protein SERLADRAFT_479912 [Serpula lacrymans var. lacrymans S7.9]